MKASIERDVTITLTLDEREAQVLATMLVWVVGLEGGPCEVADGLVEALADIDIGPGAVKSVSSAGIALPNTWEEFLA